MLGIANWTVKKVFYILVSLIVGLYVTNVIMHWVLKIDNYNILEGQLWNGLIAIGIAIAVTLLVYLILKGLSRTEQRVVTNKKE